MAATLDRPQRRAIRLLALAAFASAASARLCDPLLPELGQAFATAPTATAHVVSGFAVAYGVLQAFFGPLGDRWGKYRLIALCTLASTFGALAGAAAGSLGQLVAARVLTGATAAGIIPLAMAWIGDTVPYEERQPTLARFLAGQILGVIGGLLIGGLFADTLGWRAAFVALGAIYLAVGLLVWRESRGNPLTAPTSAGGHRGGVAAQAAAVLAAPWARVVLAVVFLEGLLVFGALAFVPTYLHQRFGLSLGFAGVLIGAFGVGGLSYISVARHLVRRLGEAGLAGLGGALIALAWALLAAAGDWGLALPACYLVGLGYYMLHNTLQTNATQMAPSVRGSAVSLFASAFFLGQAAGATLAAGVLAAWGAVALFAAAAGLILPLAAFFAASLRRRAVGAPA